MNKSFQPLYDLCIRQPFDPDAIAACIRDNQLDGAAVTRTALALCAYGEDGCHAFTQQHHREPAPEERRTYRWEALFDLLADHGLDITLTFTDEEGSEDTLLFALNYLDDGDLGARIARNLLRRGGTPNLPFEGSTLFRERDLHFCLGVLCNVFESKQTLDRDFAYWLMLLGFGGVDEEGACPVTMHHGRTPEVFREFENYSYCYTHRVEDFTLHIYEKATGLVVATLE